MSFSKGIHHIDRLRALVLASPQISESVCTLLEMYEIECVSPRPSSSACDFAWLCSILFKQSDVHEEGDADCRLFAWSRFDVVILQDLWILKSEESPARLEFAGRVFASWDNDRGNFATKKIVLVTDPELFELRARQYLNPTEDRGGSQSFRRLFDPKSSLEFVSLSSGSINSAEALRQAVMRIPVEETPAIVECDPSPDISPRVEAEWNDAIRRAITGPVIEAAAQNIRDTIPKCTKIFLVDDDENALRVAYKSITGHDLDKSGDDPSAWVHIVPISKGEQNKDGERRKAGKFKELVEECHEAIRLAKLHGNENRDIVVITDILFKNDTSSTGIDLTGELRHRYSNQICIIAFTGFSTPFIAMPAYYLGADFVVEKGGIGGRHNTLQLSGTDRLLQALTLLCFQRGYLRYLRSRGAAVFEALQASTAPDIEGLSKLIREFERTMPRRTVSTHLQREWENVLYFLKLAQICGTPGERKSVEELRTLAHRYGHA